jgi:hypothetical protein
MRLTQKEADEQRLLGLLEVGQVEQQLPFFHWFDMIFGHRIRPALLRLSGT